MRTYQHKQVVRATGLGDRQLIHLAERGFLEVVVDAQGKGTMRRYSEFGVFQAILAKIMRSNGLELRMIKKYLEEYSRRIWDLLLDESQTHFLFSPTREVTFEINLTYLRSQMVEAKRIMED